MEKKRRREDRVKMRKEWRGGDGEKMGWRGGGEKRIGNRGGWRGEDEGQRMGWREGGKRVA